MGAELTEGSAAFLAARRIAWAIGLAARAPLSSECGVPAPTGGALTMPARYLRPPPQ
jgi:hypothetical protein